MDCVNPRSPSFLWKRGLGLHPLPKVPMQGRAVETEGVMDITEWLLVPLDVWTPCFGRKGNFSIQSAVIIFFCLQCILYSSSVNP